MKQKPRFPGIRVTANGNQLVSYHTEARIADAGVFYPITPSTEGGELYQQAFSEGKLNVFGGNTIAVEAEGEHAAQGGAIAHSVCGKRVVNYTSGQGIVYGVEQYYHAPGKCSREALECVGRSMSKHSLNGHCGQEHVHGALASGRIMAVFKQAKQTADQPLILRCATENMEAAVDHLRASEKASVGSIHINVFRPFPEAAIVKALAGKKNVIILERTDEPMAGDNPMGRDIRTALNKALQGVDGIPKISADQVPTLIAGIYGLGSRDFRP